MNAFQKRVALVEKWHTDLTKSLDDMYDLAEQVLDVWEEAETYTEQRIIKLLENESEDYHRDGRKRIEMPLDSLIALIKGENKIAVSANDAEQLVEAIDAPVQSSEALKELFKGENK